MEAVYIYDAVKLYALAAHDILEHDGDPKNGTKIVETITQLGRYPSDIQGINVTVDENADSEGTSMNCTVFLKVHPNFGLVNKGVRPLLFTKRRISLNRIWNMRDLIQ